MNLMAGLEIMSIEIVHQLKRQRGGSNFEPIFFGCKLTAPFKFDDYAKIKAENYS